MLLDRFKNHYKEIFHPGSNIKFMRGYLDVNYGESRRGEVCW